MVYSTLLSLPQSYFENPYNVMIIPAFSLSESVLNPENCTGIKPCVEKSFSLPSLMNRALTLYPQTKEELVDCLNKNRCTHFRPYTKTHVLSLPFLSSRTIFLPIGPLFPRMCLTRPFHVSERSHSNPMSWSSDGSISHSSMSVSSTMVVTRCNGLNIFVTRDMNTMCFRMGLLRTCLIQSLLSLLSSSIDQYMLTSIWMD